MTDGTGNSWDGAGQKDGLRLQTDVSQTSTGGKETSQAPPFTQEDVDKAVSDALARGGRDAKTLTNLSFTLQAAQKQFDDEKTEWQKRRDEEELDKVRDDPAALTAFQVQQKQREKERDLAQEKLKLEQDRAKHAEELKEVDIIKRTQAAAEVAMRLGVEISPLLEFTDGSVEAMEKLAKHLPKTGEAKPSLKPDSNKGVGGMNFDKLSPQEKITYGLAHPKK